MGRTVELSDFIVVGQVVKWEPSEKGGAATFFTESGAVRVWVGQGVCGAAPPVLGERVRVHLRQGEKGGLLATGLERPLPGMDAPPVVRNGAMPAVAASPQPVGAR